MNCPQCGCKMKFNSCAYCKIEENQVLFASNEKAKALIKKGDTENILLSSSKPRDVNKLRLIVLTFFFGFIGVGSFYVGRIKRGWYLLLSFLIGFTLLFIKTLLLRYNMESIVFSNIATIFGMLTAITVVVWIGDCFAVLLNYFKYPIVLADKDTIKRELNENGR